MSFIQLHLLTSYAPSNLNRDDLGRPKTAVMGGVSRLRVSSQSLKRAWRTSEVFKTHLEHNIGIRTKRIGDEIFKKLKQGGIDEKKAVEYTTAIADLFGKAKSNKEEKDSSKTMAAAETEQLVHYSQVEKQAVEHWAEKIISEKPPTSNISKRGNSLKIGPLGKEILSSLDEIKTTAVDIALFGRMMASSPQYNIEAAAQVGHAISTHSVAVEDDFFTAVDDLKQNSDLDDAGAGHLGVHEFGAGLFYIYACIDKKLLIQNLDNDEKLINNTIASLITCMATVAPEGKQNSYASRARASYVRCEVGAQQPRSLSVAFLQAVDKLNVSTLDASGFNLSDKKHVLQTSIELLEQTAQKMDTCYGKCFDKSSVMNAHAGKGSLAEVIECAKA